MFTKAQLTVLFHVLNNALPDTVDAAAHYAAECDGMDRTTFITTYTRLISVIANTEGSDEL